MSEQEVIVHPDNSSSSDPLPLLAQILPLLLSAAGYPNTGKCVGWVLGMIAGSDDDISGQLADMDRKLDTINAQIAAMEARFMDALAYFEEEMRRMHWEQMVSDMKPHVARIETVYQRVQGLARLTDRDEARKHVPDVQRAILDPTTGIEYAMQTIHDLALDVLGTNGFLSTWSDTAHHTLRDEWDKRYKAAEKKHDDLAVMHAALSAEMNAHARQNILAQTEAVFAYLVGAQQKALILLCEAAHAESAVDAVRAQTLFEYFIDRYQTMMREQCVLYWQIMEQLSSRIPYTAFVCWGKDRAVDGYDRLARADRLVAAALGLESIIVIRCNWFPSLFKHQSLKPGDAYLTNGDPLLVVTDGMQQVTADSVYNPCPPLDKAPVKNACDKARCKPIRRWVFENLPNGTYRLDAANNRHAPILKIGGTTMEWGRCKQFINPTYLEIPLTIEQPQDTQLEPSKDSSRYYVSLNFRAYGPSQFQFGPQVVASGAAMAYFEEATVIESPF